MRGGPADHISRRSFLAAAGAVLGARVHAQRTAGPPSLKDACRNAFLIGTALDFRMADEFDPTELDLITSHFNVITPENSMKPGPVHPPDAGWSL